jgi:hypothetical protein
LNLATPAPKLSLSLRATFSETLDSPSAQNYLDAATKYHSLSKRISARDLLATPVSAR